MSQSLPKAPNLEQLRKQAKDLLKAHRARDRSVCPTLRCLRPFAQASDEEILAAEVSLTDAQHAVAKLYGFESWPKLKSHVELLERARRHLGHWERFRGDDDEKLRMVVDDPEWAALLRREAELEPLSREAAAIRQRIAGMEACHTCYLENVGRLLQMIGSMAAAPIFDCGSANDQRKQEARRYRDSLQAWLADQSDRTEQGRRVAQALGRRDDRKEQLVRHLVRKLGDNTYRAEASENEDFAKAESRITHLEICNHYWEQNLSILLREIGAGQRLADWHKTDGFNACGDTPSRADELSDVLGHATAWFEGRPADAEELAATLGQPTPEKTWLLQSLCKHIRSAGHQGQILR